MFNLNRIVYIVSFLMWGFALFHISSIPGGLTAQAPICMLSTMAIFGVATLAIKRLDKGEG